MNLNRLKPATQTGPQTQTLPKRSCSSEVVIFDSDCISCGNFGLKKEREGRIVGLQSVSLHLNMEGEVEY